MKLLPPDRLHLCSRQLMDVVRDVAVHVILVSVAAMVFLRVIHEEITLLNVYLMSCIVSYGAVTVGRLANSFVQWLVALFGAMLFYRRGRR